MKPDEFKNITVQLDPDLLAKVDAHAQELDLNRSQYFRRLVREDLARAEAARQLKQQELVHA